MGHNICFTETVAPSSDHYCVDIVVSSSDHCDTDTVPPSSDLYSTEKVAPPSDQVHPKITQQRKLMGEKINKSLGGPCSLATPLEQPKYQEEKELI